MTTTSVPATGIPQDHSFGGAAQPRHDAYYLLFFLSGFPALLYQIVWQRTLFTAYGVNIESVTIIVTVFMLGLGLGSLAGGWLSSLPRVNLLVAFGAIEVSVGVFGVASLHIFHLVARHTAGATPSETAVLAFALLLVPTLLMGSTLPILVEYFVQYNEHVGRSVGLLYAVNTMGSAAACFLAANFLMRAFGEAGTVELAATMNLLVGSSALILQRRRGLQSPPRNAENQDNPQAHATLPFPLGMFLTFAAGFIALAYEIIWYREVAFASGGTAPAFAMLLAFYLAGIGYGALKVHDFFGKNRNDDTQRPMQTAATVFLLGSIFAFLVGPVLGWQLMILPGLLLLPVVFAASALQGSAFPLLCHVAIGGSSSPGKKLSYLYLSNIIGSALGSFLVGFIVLDHLSTEATSLLLLVLGILVSVLLALSARPFQIITRLVATGAAALLLASLAHPIYAHMYPEMLYKDSYRTAAPITDLLENRSGIIAVASDGTIFGGGVYDGHFNTNLLHDTNKVIRPDAIPGIAPHPTKVLMIGLSSGSWAQIVAANPAVNSFTIVEINPGYLPLIRAHSPVASILHNPKVHIIIDDGRRWLLSNPDREFDLIAMNTTFNWRANVSDLLSRDFLLLVRKHLKPGGIFFYNTTWSREALATGIQTYPYALRVDSCLAVSDSPIRFDKQAWNTALENYRIDGRPVVDLTDPAQRAALTQVEHQADFIDTPGSLLQSRESLLRDTSGARVITDNNMGTEWR